MDEALCVTYVETPERKVPPVLNAVTLADEPNEKGYGGSVSSGHGVLDSW